jgi:predicted glycoside hydrolase/deacetylase ChbG (UPF0249 family)
MTPLIISADDYAQSVAIDRGIRSLVEKSRISAFSCLVLSPRWPEAARSVTADIRDKADVGLHLDFTQYPQVTRTRLPLLILKSLVRGLPRRAIRASIITQLNHFEDALGTAPDYIDGHQHVHQLPQIRDELVDVMLQRYPHRLPWLRIANSPVSEGLKGLIIGALGSSALARSARRHGIRHTRYLLGVYGFDGNASAYGERLAGWLSKSHTLTSQGSAPSCALMCHPAVEYEPSTDQLLDPIYAARLNEYRILSNEALPGLMAKYQVQLARGDSLKP